MSQLDALLLSLAVEVPLVIGGLIVLTDRDETPRWRIIAIALAATLLTHPLAWAASRTPMPGLSLWERAALIELSVVFAEGLLFALAIRVGASAAMLISLLANAASFGVGLLWMR